MPSNSPQRNPGHGEENIPPRIFVLACDVLQEEIETISDSLRHVVRWEFLPMGLHDRPRQMRMELQAWIEVAEADPRVEAIVLIYGLCGHGTAGLTTKRVPLILPRAHDCITLFIGSAKRYQDYFAEHPDAYFYTPGWMRENRTPGPEREKALRKQLEERYDDPETIEMLMEAEASCWQGNHHATYVDFGLPQHHALPDRAKSCADRMGWSFEKIHGDPTLLHDTLGGNWKDDTHLIIQPGQSIQPSYDDRIVCAKQR